MEDIDIPTLMEISNFTGLWVSDYAKFLRIKQDHCNDNNDAFVSNNLEFFGLIIYGIFKIKGFTLKNTNDNNKDIIPWKCDPITKSFIKLELIHTEYPPDWIFTIKITSLFASNFIITINANLLHTITKLQNIQNWKVIFKTSTPLDSTQMLTEVFRSPLSETFAQLIGNELYQTFLKKFWNLWTLHVQNINELKFDEDTIIKTLNKNKKLLDSFESFNNTNSNRKLPYSLLTLRHIYLSFLCHLILQHVEWQSFGLYASNNDDDDDTEMEIKDEEKAMEIDDDTLYGNTPQNDDLSVIATRITRCMRYHRPFDLKYKVILPNGKDIKYIKIRYISMEHCALIVVNDEELLKCNISSPKVKLTLNTYINDTGDITNLSGRKSLIKLLCENIVRRARDPLETASSTSGLIDSKVFSIDVLVMLFGFIYWKDVLNFGYCSQLCNNISKDPEIWKAMYQREYSNDNVDSMAVVNWKHKFVIEYLLREKRGTDQATMNLIQQLLQQELENCTQLANNLMASELLKPADQDIKNKKQNARSTTMLVHEIPMTHEIYESFVWDPDEELIFESESSISIKEEDDLSFLFLDSSGEQMVALTSEDEKSSSLSSSSFATPGWEDNLTENIKTISNQNPNTDASDPINTSVQIVFQESAPPQSANNGIEPLSSYKRKQAQVQSEPQIPEWITNPILRPKYKSQSEHNITTKSQNAQTQYISETKDNVYKPKTIKTETDHDTMDNIKHNDALYNEQSINTQIKQSITQQTPMSPRDIADVLTELEQAEDVPRIDKKRIQIAINDQTFDTKPTHIGLEPMDNNKDTYEHTPMSPKDIANVLIQNEDEDDYQPVKLCVTQFKRKRKGKRDKKRKRDGQLQPRKLSTQQRDKIIRKHSRALKGTIECPRLPPQVIVEGNVEIITPVCLVHLFARVRTHHRLNNYKNINYACKSYQLKMQLVLSALDDEKEFRGEFKIGDCVYAFLKKNIGTQKEYKMALRTNSNDIDHARLLLHFVESKMDESLQNVQKITKFNHEVCIQSIMTELNK